LIDRITSCWNRIDAIIRIRIMGCNQSNENRFPGHSLSADRSPVGPSESKVVLLGDCGVGKSSIALRFVQQKFSSTHHATIGAAFASKDVSVKIPGSSHQSREAVVRLQIWDTAGEEKYRSMTRFYFRNTNVGILVYDVTDESSFTNVRSWEQDLLEHCPDAKIVVVGNKVDLADAGERAVSMRNARQWCEEQGHRHIECSAKSGANVNDIFRLAALLCAA